MGSRLREVDDASYGLNNPSDRGNGGYCSSGAYTVKVYYQGDPVGNPYETTVVPADVSTTIGLATVPQMLTLPQASLSIYKWREVIR